MASVSTMKMGGNDGGRGGEVVGRCPFQGREGADDEAAGRGDVPVLSREVAAVACSRKEKGVWGWAGPAEAQEKWRWLGCPVTLDQANLATRAKTKEEFLFKF
jgi:hypothetical protein